MIKIIYAQISDKLGRISRLLFRNRRERKQLTNRNFTIFSQNCIGSIWYHDLGLQFCSPTINMLFKGTDFIKFMENPKEYLGYTIRFIDGKGAYPIGFIKDIRIEFVHYHSKEEVLESWNKRVKRINWNNLFVVCCDEGLTTDDIVRFDKLPYKNKIIFLSRPLKNIKSGIYCKDFKDGTDARLLNFSNPFGGRYYQKYFNYIDFLNKS